jgi:hypothetical protein
VVVAPVNDDTLNSDEVMTEFRVRSVAIPPDVQNDVFPGVHTEEFREAQSKKRLNLENDVGHAGGNTSKRTS